MAFLDDRILLGPRQTKKVHSNMHYVQIKIIVDSAKYHPGVGSPFVHSVVSIDSVIGQ